MSFQFGQEVTIVGALADAGHYGSILSGPNDDGTFNVLLHHTMTGVLFSIVPIKIKPEYLQPRIPT